MNADNTDQDWLGIADQDWLGIAWNQVLWKSKPLKHGGTEEAEEMALGREAGIETISFGSKSLFNQWYQR
jgi:hypothetical protein